MLIADATTTRDLLPFARLIDALRRAFGAAIEVPARHVHQVGPVGAPALGTSLIMPAWDARFYGVKTVNIFAGNPSRGLPALHSSYMLYDVTTGVPLALLDGDEITSRRTAAASALAASMLARPDAADLLVIGPGRIGRLVPLAMRAVLPIARVSVWGRDARAARECVEALRGVGVSADVAPDLEAAVRAADIVSCATLSTAPVVASEWLRPGSHLDLIGSFTPLMQEAHPSCFADASVWVDTMEALTKSGDLLRAFEAGALRQEDVAGDLARLCRQDGAAASNDHDHTFDHPHDHDHKARRRTVFKAVGTALEDLAAASLVYEQLAGAPAA